MARRGWLLPKTPKPRSRSDATGGSYAKFPKPSTSTESSSGVLEFVGTGRRGSRDENLVQRRHPFLDNLRAQFLRRRPQLDQTTVADGRPFPTAAAHA